MKSADMSIENMETLTELGDELTLGDIDGERHELTCVGWERRVAVSSVVGSCLRKYVLLFLKGEFHCLRILWKVIVM